jgi:hypothetical protein
MYGNNNVLLYVIWRISDIIIRTPTHVLVVYTTFCKCVRYVYDGLINNYTNSCGCSGVSYIVCTLYISIHLIHGVTNPVKFYALSTMTKLHANNCILLYICTLFLIIKIIIIISDSLYPRWHSNPSRYALLSSLFYYYYYHTIVMFFIMSTTDRTSSPTRILSKCHYHNCASICIRLYSHGTFASLSE